MQRIDSPRDTQAKEEMEVPVKKKENPEEKNNRTKPASAFSLFLSVLAHGQ